MSAVCTVALAFGLTLGGHCTAVPAPTVAEMPQNDPSA